ncbi:MAG: hypothetical protein K6T31_01020 [Alicyclobacillus sp.]|nr:hypothetical protein [Alicyclobacillus sp.]
MTVHSGGQWVMDELVAAGVDRVFFMPGEGALDLIDAFYQHPHIQAVSTRHATGAGLMAEAYAKLTGRPGVCLAGHPEAAISLLHGMRVAYHDGTPLLALVCSPDSERLSEQDVTLYLHSCFSPVCKAVLHIQSTKQIPGVLQHAFTKAQKGRPGPVVVLIPANILASLEPVQSRPHHLLPVPAPRAESIDFLWNRLKTAQQPVVIAGSGVLRAQAESVLVSLAERLAWPVLPTVQRLDAFPNQHGCYAGWIGEHSAPHVIDILNSADLVLALGCRLRRAAGGGFSAEWMEVSPEPSLASSEFPARWSVVADIRSLLEALWARVQACANAKDLVGRERQARVQAWHQAYTAYSTPEPVYRHDGLDLTGLFYDLTTFLPQDAILTCESGQFMAWAARFCRFHQPGTFLSTELEPVDYGLPAAVSAKLARPQQQVVALCGDGGFLRSVQELETAVRLRLPLLILVFNNQGYGRLRALQERRFPGRTFGTRLGNPDFAELARSFGAFGVRVTRNTDVLPALEAAAACGRPAVIEVRTDPAVLLP